MTKLVSTLFLGLLLLTACQPSGKEPSFTQIEKGFRNVPDSVRLAAYWYWISDNISKEGVIKDLEAMKEAGITRAFIGNIGIDNIPFGPHKILSDEWWEITHAALKRASELDIEMGIFNSPGWSQSGGPWIKPNESMRYLASSQVTVKGGQQLNMALPEVGKDAEDVKVIAFPVPGNKAVEKNWEIKKTNGEPATVNMALPNGATARSLSVQVNTPIRTEAELYVKENNEYKLLKKFGIDRSNAALNVGFIPYPPVVISLPETKAQDFRLVVSRHGQATMNVTLSSKPMVERYPEKTLAKMFQTPLPLWHDYMWEKQPEVTEINTIVNPSEVIDLTASFKDGKLTWDAPEGEWTIMRTAMLSTNVTNAPASPEATGLEVDKMSKTHVAKHFDSHMGEILRRIPPEDRTSLKVVVQDSYETGGQNWTDDMAEVFEQTYGYSAIPYLPVLQGVVVGSPDMSDRFLWDLRRLVADRVSYDYVGGLREISHQHGLTTWLENYGHWGFPGEFLQYGGQSDEVGGEFWSEGSLGDIENRAASSCAHIYGKKKVWAESFTSGGPNFGRYPYTMKQRGDRFFTEGINATLLHLYIHQPYEDRDPGMSAWFGNDFHRKNTWFSHMDLFSDYLRRCNFMLQQGTYIADVAYYIGEDAPKMTGVTDPALPKGYSFDYINAEVLMKYASVKDSKLTLESGMRYKVLVLPKQETMRPEVLEKIKDLVSEGLILLGTAPQYSPSLANYPRADERVKHLAAELWGTSLSQKKEYGKGTVYTNTSLENIFAQQGIIPDCAATDNKTEILFIHRATAEGDMYFVSNPKEETVQFPVDFRVTGKQPELWNPLTGEIRLLPEYKINEQTTSTTLKLEPFESAFIVFRNSPENSKATANNPQANTLLTLTNPWDVMFTGVKIPEKLVKFNSLTDWSKSDDPDIKYFSGKADYYTEFTMNDLPKEEIYVDLGKVMVMAKVWVNDEYAGGVWTNPYRLNITPYIRKGNNSLRVEVTNNWMNRLIGEQQLPEEERIAWTPVNPWNANSTLQPSGLLGPVQIQSYNYDIVK